MEPGLLSNEILSLAYGTSTNRHLWGDFCRALHDCAGAPVKIVGHDFGADGSPGFVAGGWDPEHLEQYRRYYGALNPWMHMNLAMKPGQVGISDEALPRSELIKTEFYNDWLRQHDDMIGGPAMMCHRSSDRFVLLVAACRQVDVDRTLGRNVALLQQLAPHLMRVIHNSIALCAPGKPFLAHLEASRHGIALVKRSGTVEFANRHAETHFRECGSLWIDPSGKLNAGSEDHRRFLSMATTAMVEQDFAALPGPLAIQSPVFGQCVVHPHVFPDEVDNAFPETVWQDPIVGGFVISGGFTSGGGDEYQKIARSFGATPAESRLAQAIVAGETLAEYAERTAISRYTARNQMQSLLQRSGTRSQAEFVRHILNMASPFEPFGH